MWWRLWGLWGLWWLRVAAVQAWRQARAANDHHAAVSKASEGIGSQHVAIDKAKLTLLADGIRRHHTAAAVGATNHNGLAALPFGWVPIPQG